MHAYAPNGTVARTGPLPESWKLSDGRTVSGFDQMTAAQQKAEGWYPVTEQFASLAANQHHGPPVYTVRANDVLAAYPAENDSAETVNQKSNYTNMQADLAKMQTIIDTPNATINASPAAYIKDNSRAVRRILKQLTNEHSTPT